MTVEGRHPPPSDATDGRWISSNAVRILPRPIKGASPPAFGNADRMFDLESKPRFKNSGALVINEGGLIQQKKSFDYTKKGKMVMKEVMEEVPSFFALQRSMNNTGQIYKIDSTTIDLKSDLETTKEVLLNKDGCSSLISNEVNLNKNSIVGNFEEVPLPTGDMVNVCECISADLGNCSKEVNESSLGMLSPIELAQG
ncbi:hypothetical protein MA16_Dca010488 [Dendrobium catenatum]|uniref:Uncharacterized protein n=1 Tax=Dendrobium catenatum TaxID=906689 RepID=A0A2I0XD13_9ASPA|nr:hypothetical protein MA16_Dca010488 [Dendrobium catenatum]